MIKEEETFKEVQLDCGTTGGIKSVYGSYDLDNKKYSQIYFRKGRCSIINDELKLQINQITNEKTRNLYKFPLTLKVIDCNDNLYIFTDIIIKMNTGASLADANCYILSSTNFIYKGQI